MDISNLNVDQLKIVAYDLMDKIEVLNRDLNLVRNRINYILQQNEQSQTPVMPIPQNNTLNTTVEVEKKHKK